MEKMKRAPRFSSFRTIVLAFLGVIAAGTVLLMLPVSSASGRSAGFLTALFTSTSSVCVTGLVVVDTATSWSMFGQFVILVLIQIGGLGVITIALLVTMLSGRKIGLVQRSVMSDAISSPQIGGILRMTGLIFRIAVIAEGAGAVLLMPAFIPLFGVGKGIWYAVFHSVSAFCNAGFDLMGVEAPFGSLTGFSSNAGVNLVVILLIIAGGLGFFTWRDLLDSRFRFRSLSPQSKIILCTTAVLIAVPFFLFFFMEFTGQPLAQRFWMSLFQAVTPRTAGFNTADLNTMSEAGRMIIILLMLIGGAPASTAGGMKVTTAALLFLSLRATIKKDAYPNCFAQRIGTASVRTAVAVFLIYLSLFVTGSAVISRIENLPLLTCAFEAASALGTVGLTLGITPSLHAASRIILIVFMFIGRVGGLTMAYAFRTAPEEDASTHMPKVQVMIG